MHNFRMLSRTTVLALLTAASAFAAEPPPAAPTAASPPPAATSVATTAAVPLAQDACLDHTVRELGMSAKKAEGAPRHWDIAPKFLHGALAKDATAAFTVDLEKTDKAALVKVKATWPGAPKAKEVQLEIEERLRVMTAKMAQTCGVPRADVTCTTTPAGGVAAPCVPPAAAP